MEMERLRSIGMAFDEVAQTAKGHRDIEQSQHDLAIQKRKPDHTIRPQGRHRLAKELTAKCAKEQ